LHAALARALRDLEDRHIADIPAGSITSLVAADAGRQGCIAEFGANVSSFEDPNSVVESAETCPDPFEKLGVFENHSLIRIAVVHYWTDRSTACGRPGK